MTSGSSSRLFRIITLVDPPRLAQPIFFAARRNELPHAFGLGPRYGTGFKGTFSLGQVNEVQRNAFFLQNAFDHRLESPHALQSDRDRAAAAAILVIIEESKNPVVDLDREIVSKFFDVVFDCFLEL